MPQTVPLFQSTGGLRNQKFYLTDKSIDTTRQRAVVFLLDYPMIDYEKFQKSLRPLALQFENYQGMDQQNLPKLTQEAIAESVVQRFETCYDCMWKVLRRYLIEELGLPDVPNSPKPVIRLAHENDLLASVDQWLAYADARTGTANDYSGLKAKEALNLMGDFIRDAVRLYQQMSGETWQP